MLSPQLHREKKEGEQAALNQTRLKQVMRYKHKRMYLTVVFWFLFVKDICGRIASQRLFSL